VAKKLFFVTPSSAAKEQAQMMPLFGDAFIKKRKNSFFL
jgi:hypothetical protein